MALAVATGIASPRAMPHRPFRTGKGRIDMLESIAFSAFAMGILSTCSLPLGTLTTRFWTPGDRSVAWLMAFGGGALLAALTIDLVGSALEKGHFYPMAAGAILGGLMFMGLNNIINSYGGFLRKSSTTLYYLRKKRQERFRHILGHIGRVPLFKGLPAKVRRELANAVQLRDYPRDTVLYHRFDPPDNLYILEEGAVDLLEPRGTEGLMPFRQLKPHDAFGRLAFLTCSPHATQAVTRADSRVWVLGRKEFNRLLQASPFLAEALQSFILGPKVDTYLRERHGMNDRQARNWVAAAVDNLRTQGQLEAAVVVVRHDKEFAAAAAQFGRLPIFAGLPSHELEAIVSRVFSKQYRRGDAFFHHQERADRMFIIEQGEVALIDPHAGGRSSVSIGDRQVFGGLSFLTGSRHSVSAVATRDTLVWVLRRSDFDDLLRRAPRFAEQVKAYLQQSQVRHYLEQKQRFDPERAASWTQSMVDSMDTEQLLPAAGDMAAEVKAHQGAPVAIWLGNLLDAIPESLVIGSSMIHSSLSLSLLAGMFLSNYPEALSSSVGMRQQGMSFRRVLLMWTALMFLTGLGAAIGHRFFTGVSPQMFSLVEGLAAGSMLTMIAETMLPEAYFKGGSIIGFATLLGFLAAIFFSTLE